MNGRSFPSYDVSLPDGTIVIAYFLTCPNVKTIYFKILIEVIVSPQDLMVWNLILRMRQEK